MYVTTSEPAGSAAGPTPSLPATEAVGLAASELAEREARYRGIVETSLEGIWMFDPDGATTFANERMAALLATTPERLAVSTVFDVVRPVSHPGVRRVLDELRRGESARFDTSLLRADGTEVAVDLVVSALRDQRGTHLGGLAMVSDATERRAALAALADEQERLTQTLEAGGMAAWELDLATGTYAVADNLAAVFGTDPDLEALHDLGVALAVDDFSTGYSSLLYVRRFPVGILKLDRAFVSGLGHNGADEAIVGSMIDLAHSLGIVAVAEGVETTGQLSALERLGCDAAQGYLWSAPLPAATADRLLAPDLGAGAA